METKTLIIFIDAKILESKLFVGNDTKNIQGYYFSIKQKSNEDQYSFNVQMKVNDQIKYEENIKDFFEAEIDLRKSMDEGIQLKRIEYFQKKHLDYFDEFDKKFITSYISHDDLLYLKNKGGYVGIFGSKLDAGKTEVIDSVVKKADNKIHFTLKFSHFEATTTVQAINVKPPEVPSTTFTVPCPPRWDEL